MTNEEIIAGVAISSGIYTEEEVNEMLEDGREIPLHTLQGWSVRGKRIGKTIKIKKGEHGIETRLWKKKDEKVKDEVEPVNEQEQLNRKFYLAKAYLFTKEQIEILAE